MLADGGTMKALQVLHDSEELGPNGGLNDENHYNYGAVLSVAKLWSDGKIDRAWHDKMLEKYGKYGRYFDIVRMSMFVFSRHMPIEIAERQWLHGKMAIEIGGTRVRQQHVRALPSPRD